MMKTKSLMRLYLFLFLFQCGALPAQDAFQGILPVTDKAMKRSLNGMWHLKVMEGIADDDIVPPLDATWGTIPVPGCWETYGFCKPSYDKTMPMTGYYRTSFRVPKEWRGQRIVIRFDGVLYGYDLWVNDHRVGTWRSGYNTALFDITECLTGSAEELSMRVISQFPGSDFDYNDDWAPNGIFRDVTLMAVPDTHLADLTIKPKVTGEVEVTEIIANADKRTKVTHEIVDAQGSCVGSNRVAHPHLWTAETPYLYTLRTKLTKGNKVLQTFEHKFGFRELTIDGNVLKLNGQPIKLRGVTSHATDPRTVKVISEELTKKDMRLMKEASVNYIRTSHYPREPRFYDLADSLGFYIIDEVPFGYGDKHLIDEAYYPMLRQRAQATVRRDKNHASVLMWSIGNENPLTEICIRLGNYVKTELDSTRPVCYPQVGSYFRSFNYDFPKVADIYAPHYPTTGQLRGFYQHADRPVIFTEYLHSLGISFEDHDRQWDIIERSPAMAGGSVWEWVDQGMPFDNESLDTTDKQHATSVSYGYEERVFTSAKGGFEMHGNKGTDGLLYADRTPLPNYYELQHNYAQAVITDSILTLSPEKTTVELHISNKYDFINLKDHVTFRWTLSQDRDTIADDNFSPDCPPHHSVCHTLTLPPYLNYEKICLLNVEMSDSEGRTFNRQSIPINPAELTERLLKGLTIQTDDPMICVQGGLMIRAGRKATMAESLKVGDRLLKQYLLPLSTDSTTAGNITTAITTQRVGNATHYSFSLTPASADTFYSELGVAFLLNPQIDRVQWIGQGVMPTYPGRYRAGRYGFWSLQQGDLYFEGNRRGVDAALLTDKEGNGLLMVCNQGNVSFEQTDKGIVLTYNAAVAGQGPKFARTAFPAFTDGMQSVRGDFYLYLVDASTAPPIIQSLFIRPCDIPMPFHPYITQYDTYLMRFDDIFNSSSQ